MDKSIVDKFHLEYYNSGVWEQTRYMGIPIAKCPFDLWVYHELIHYTKPKTIIETGTWFGGSALYFLHQMQLVGIYNPKVITIDINPQNDLVIPGIIKFKGGSIDKYLFEKIINLIEEPTMAILDSNHGETYVTEEIKLYSTLVSTNQYLIVEDTNLDDNPIHKSISGPYKAVEKFLKSTDEFVADQNCEKFGLTFNPNGWLKRIKESIQ